MLNVVIDFTNAVCVYMARVTNRQLIQLQGKLLSIEIRTRVGVQPFKRVCHRCLAGLVETHYVQVQLIQAKTRSRTDQRHKDKMHRSENGRHPVW